MKETGNIFCRAVMAGLGIAMGGIVYLSMENQVIGAFLFAIGLYAIVLNGLFLYTGKVGYLVVEMAAKSISKMADGSLHVSLEQSLCFVFSVRWRQRKKRNTSVSYLKIS